MRLTYVGPPRGVSMFAQMLREKDVTVDYRPPVEHKSWGSAIESVAVALTLAGPVAMITAVATEFMQRVRGARIEGLPAPAARSTADRLAELARLREDGHITAAEHDQTRQRILGEL